MPSLTFNITHGTPRHRKVLEAILERHRLADREASKNYARWRRNEELMRAFMPEKDSDRVRRFRRETQGQPEYTTIVLPYTYGYVLTALTYQVSALLARSPIWQLDVFRGGPEDSALAMESVLDYQVQVGGQIVPLILWFYDALRYGVGVVAPYWISESYSVATIARPGVDETGAPSSEPMLARETIDGYSGNKLAVIPPYWWRPDPRYPYWKFQEGEFCGNYVEFSRHELQARARAGYFIKANVDHLIATGGGKDATLSGVSHEPVPGASQTRLGSSYEGRRTETDIYGAYSYVVKLVPREWGIDDGDQVEKWLITFDQSGAVVLGVQPLGLLHNDFPYSALLSDYESHSENVIAMPQNLEPIQNVMDWLVNTHFYNVRQALNNQWLVDESAIDLETALDPVGGKLILRKPAGYGRPTNQIFEQLQHFDVTRSHMDRDMEAMHGIGQRAFGINDQVLGGLSSGGRKTAAEVRTGSTFSVSRLKQQADWFSVLGMSPLARQLLSNTQQYYEGEDYFRVVGEDAARIMERMVKVTPRDIAANYGYVPTDGTIQIDRFAQVKLWTDFMAQLNRAPQAASQIDLAKLMVHVLQLGGIRNPNAFRIKLQPGQQVAAQAQAGNVVPLNPADNSADAGVTA